MKKNSGFTVIELMVVIVIVAILAAITIPGFMEWRSNSRIRGAANNLRADFELAKIQAIRNNTTVAIEFLPPNYTAYRVYADPQEDWVLDMGDRVFCETTFPAGLAYDSGKSTFTSERTRFNGRGMPDIIGAAVLVQGDTEYKLTMNRVGRISLEKIKG